ncbi:hypothetical protein [Streptacidiphilus sp. EB129]|uniref:hypothetical protein n=1 Tax=Streptacidiphilus sp. EB129 TaxID=3156262 RepID=UPI003518EB80
MTTLRPRISARLAGLPPARYSGSGTPEADAGPMPRAFRLVVDGLAYNGAAFPDGRVVLDLGGHGLHTLDGGVGELLAMNPGGRIEWADQAPQVGCATGAPAPDHSARTAILSLLCSRWKDADSQAKAGARYEAWLDEYRGDVLREAEAAIRVKADTHEVREERAAHVSIGMHEAADLIKEMRP